jgi:SAM-dependent methyltransferase
MAALRMETPEDPTIAYYQTHARRLTRRYEKAEVEQLHRRLLAAFPAGAQLLDVGSGSGREAAFLLSRGFRVTCLEPSPAMIDHALSYHSELAGRIIRGRLPDELPVEAERFDGIYAVASLMHLYRRQLPAALAQLYRALLPGGTLLFSVPLSRPDLTASGYDEAGRYFLLMSAQEWVAETEAAGFRDVQTDSNADGMGRSSVTWLNCSAVK